MLSRDRVKNQLLICKIKCSLGNNGACTLCPEDLKSKYFSCLGTVNTVTWIWAFFLCRTAVLWAPAQNSHLLQSPAFAGTLLHTMATGTVFPLPILHFLSLLSLDHCFPTFVTMCRCLCSPGLRAQLPAPPLSFVWSNIMTVKEKEIHEQSI